MNFQQLRTFRDLVRLDLDLARMAALSHTGQPGLLRQIRDLENQLGLAVFERRGKRLAGLSEAGKTIYRIVDRLLGEADTLLASRSLYAGADSGRLVLATTHAEARHLLAPAVLGLRAAFPQVRLEMRQSAPEHIARCVIGGTADIGIAGEDLAAYPELLTFPCRRWRYQALVPDGHPLLALAAPTLADLAAYPIVTYGEGLDARRHVDAAFRGAGLAPDIVLTALDADIVKQYVGLGFGVGLLAPPAPDTPQEHGLRVLEVGALFDAGTTLIAVRRGACLRAYALDFIRRVAPWLTPQEIERALDGGGQAPGPERRAAADGREADENAPALAA